MPHFARPASRRFDPAALALAIALTLVMVWAAADWQASHVYPMRLHVQMHLASFALFGAVWARGLPRLGLAWIVGALWMFGLAHEGWQIVGHHHGFEGGDVLIDGLGGTLGALLARSPLLPRAGRSQAAG
ncbi:hypothetical protein [Derxia lacustris]|uniref:hypothetical protein n=1 Tax=Derxia lacustris TaxID=764842 RepID=UPI000A17373F|nr:hypothetical protein [Derxia lacustris]